MTTLRPATATELASEDGPAAAAPAGDRSDFFAAVYDLVRAVPPGKVTTYGWLARRLHRPQHARLVGYALHSVRPGDCVPCHRVVNSQGRLSGAPHFGPPGQKAMLEAEGVIFRGDAGVDLTQSLWWPGPEPGEVAAPVNAVGSLDDNSRAASPRLGDRETSAGRRAPEHD